MPSRFYKTATPGALILVMLVALGGCATMSVNYDYDNDVDWDAHRTYSWLSATTPAPTNAANAQLSGDLLDKRIRAAVAHEMGARNIKAGENPDILIKYYVGTEEKMQVTDWGYHYSDYYRGYGGQQIEVFQFTQGTLVIDIIDARSKALIWRGTATGSVDGAQHSPEEQQTRINTVVFKILEKYPPQ